MKNVLFVGLVLIFSVFLFCVGITRSEAASASPASVNKEIDASNIGFKTLHKIANRESFNVWGPSTNSFGGEFAYSPDGQYLLYTQTLPKNAGSQIVILNVATRTVKHTFKMEFNNGDPLWSHDGQLILTCYRGGFSIYEIKSGKHTKVDGYEPCSKYGRALWYMNEEILIWTEEFTQTPSKYSVFNLDSLSDTDISTEEANKIIEKLIPNNLGKAHFYIGKRIENITSWPYLGISNNDDSFEKVLVDDDVGGYALSPKYDSTVRLNSKARR